MVDEVKCPNCKGYLASSDNYCRYCGSPRDAESSEPRGSAMSCESGIFTVLRKHECFSCGHKWETDVRQDCQRYCPECGHDTYLDVDLARIYEGETGPFADVNEAVWFLWKAGVISNGEFEQADKHGDVWWYDCASPCTKVWLFNGEHPDYPRISYAVTADVYEQRVFFSESAYDMDWGPHDSDRPSVTHTVGGSSLEVFKAALDPENAGLAAAIGREFSGSKGIEKLKSFCSSRGIELRSFL